MQDQGDEPREWTGGLVALRASPVYTATCATGGSCRSRCLSESSRTGRWSMFEGDASWKLQLLAGEAVLFGGRCWVSASTPSALDWNGTKVQSHSTEVVVTLCNGPVSTGKELEGWLPGRNVHRPIWHFPVRTQGAASWGTPPPRPKPTLNWRQATDSALALLCSCCNRPAVHSRRWRRHCMEEEKRGAEGIRRWWITGSSERSEEEIHTIRNATLSLYVHKWRFSSTLVAVAYSP